MSRGPRGPRGRLAALVLAACATGASAPCLAGAFRYCDPPAELDAVRQDEVLRLGAEVKRALESSGVSAALVARSGIDLDRFGMRYSHAGVALRDHPAGPWTVRQLYFDCGERRPRLFDEGVPGFLFGAAGAPVSWLSVVLVPGADDALARTALDARRATGLVGAAYSANAHAFAARYQNCNQWVAELLGLAWGAVPDGATVRDDAQRWLRAQGYVPAVFEPRNPVMTLLGGVLPWLHMDDHPSEDIAEGVYRVSMPQSLEAFVRARVPGARRMEFCLADRRIVVREGWTPIAAGCVPRDGDRVVALDG
ncbi:MAG: DUF2145 domain-containing protein [Burkholderiales bacterium]